MFLKSIYLCLFYKQYQPKWKFTVSGLAYVYETDFREEEHVAYLMSNEWF